MGDEDTMLQNDWPSGSTGFWPEPDAPESDGSGTVSLLEAPPDTESDSAYRGVNNAVLRQGSLFPDAAEQTPDSPTSIVSAPRDPLANLPPNIGHIPPTPAGPAEANYRPDPLEPSPNKFVNLFEASSPESPRMKSLVGPGAPATGQAKSGEPLINSYEASSGSPDSGGNSGSRDSLLTQVKGKLPSAVGSQAGGGEQANPAAPPQQQGTQTAGDKPQMRPDLGDSVKGFESGKRGVSSVSSGVLKDGVPDPGGVSYGTYQLNSKNGAGTVKQFIESPEGKQYASEFAGLPPGSPEFSAKWNEIANRDPEGLHQAEKAFIYRTHYLPVAQQAAKLGFDMSNPAIQDAIWSGSIQHGKFGRVLDAASQDPILKDMCGDAEDQLRVLYGYRGDYARSNKVAKSAGVGRYARELPVLLENNKKYQAEKQR